MNRWVVVEEVLREETGALRPRLALAGMLMGFLPPFVGNRLRPVLLRWAGIAIGRGTVVWGRPTIVGTEQADGGLSIGRDCVVNDGCHFDACAMITIEDRVSIGQQVMILTNAHVIADGEKRAGPNQISPVTIGAGAWLSTRCTILPGVTVGEGAVVAAGAVVIRDVESHTLVGGVPATLIRRLDPDVPASKLSREVL